MKRFLVLPLVIGLASCSWLVEQNPLRNAGPIGDIAAKGVQDADYNLQQAAQLNIIPPDDAVAACVHGAATDIAQASGSFEAHISDLVSAASVIYIQRIQSQRLQGAVLRFLGCLAGSQIVPLPLGKQQK